MNFWNFGIVLFIFFGLTRGRQFCGSDLADVMQLVCNGRGYNVAFTSDFNPSEKRFKRGIVDECCRRGCSWSTLETYCSPNPPNVQIRKRSNFPSKWEPDSSETLTKIEKFKYETYQSKSEEKISFDNNMPPYPNQFISLWDEKDRHSQPPRSHTLVNKVKRNDINEDVPFNKPEKRPSLSFPIDWRDVKMEIGKRGNQIGGIASTSLPIRLRHRKSKITKENGNSQVGTVPPYFLGRTLVLPPSLRKV